MSETTEERSAALKMAHRVELMGTYQYAWCACGLSKYQPFCDGSHTSSAAGIKPIIWIQENDAAVHLCGCKRSRNKPHCDGSQPFCSDVVKRA